MTLQALSQDLLRVSVRLESLDEQLESCSNVTHTNGLTTEDLKKERDLLIKRRDSLDAQLKDNRVLTVEVRIKCVCDVNMYNYGLHFSWETILLIFV